MIMVIILTPFPHIATHVINTQLIGEFLAYRFGASWGIILFKPTHFFQVIAPRIEVVFGICSSSGSVFPLSFRKKTVAFSRLLVELLNEFFCLIPGDGFYRVFGALEF